MGNKTGTWWHNISAWILQANGTIACSAEGILLIGCRLLRWNCIPVLMKPKGSMTIAIVVDVEQAIYTDF